MLGPVIARNSGIVIGLRDAGAGMSTLKRKKKPVLRVYAKDDELIIVKDMGFEVTLISVGLKDANITDGTFKPGTDVRKSRKMALVLSRAHDVTKVIRELSKM